MANDSKLDIRAKKNLNYVLQKRKLDTFAADSLDNNATVEKIFEYLESKNKHSKAYKFYCLNLRQTRRCDTLHYLVPGHPLNAFHEEWDGGLKSGYFESFSHKSMKPKMITEIRNMHVKDPVTETMAKKIDWNLKWRTYRRLNTITSDKRRYKWHNDNVLECPKAFVEMAEHWEQNPDVFFDSNYNWYYAGNGNMQLINFHGSDYLLHSELNCLWVTPFSKDNLILNYEKELIYDCKDTILETVSCQNLIAVRTKNKIIILKLTESDDKICIEKLKDIESKLPFTSISFDEYHKNILYVTTLDYKLTIVNTDRMTGRNKQLRGRIKTLTNNWSSVIASERCYYTHITKDSIVLYDKRTNNAFQRWKDIEKVADEFLCNDITVAKHCKGRPLLYFGTEHHLFLMDMRYNASNKLIPVQRWMHGMQCPPTYMSICSSEIDREFVFLSSQWCEDMCVTNNYAKRLESKADISSVSIPYRPPSVFSTLREAHQKSLFCELENPINNRLSTAITGMTIVPQDEKYFILMQNSLGDISSHALFPKHMTMFIDDDSVEQLYEWSNSYKVESKEFEVSKVVNIRNLWKRLKKVPGDYKFEESKYLKDSKFNEQDIYDDFENDELESGLLDIWIKEQNQEHDTIEEASQFFE
ncbi:hypothetical protein K1T71_009100 [Dendrolimus kikuchii]|uniref:Uncharacterized protein n=1 Tax=Dendrolimus kikuchii TaxID=765133 RepID=A0ACC1CTE5_9NEOP|nr:hypothetical protein K1T71_009100 [Dendrolimus kikuchii]